LTSTGKYSELRFLSGAKTIIAQKIASSDEQLHNVAPGLITAGGRPVGPEETPVPDLSVPGTSKTLRQHHGMES